jgi:hypothetical protein
LKTFFDENLQRQDGCLQIDNGNVIDLKGLDDYCLAKLSDRFHYDRKDTPSKSFFKQKISSGDEI